MSSLPRDQLGEWVHPSMNKMMKKWWLSRNASFATHRFEILRDRSHQIWANHILIIHQPRLGCASKLEAGRNSLGFPVPGWTILKFFLAQHFEKTKSPTTLAWKSSFHIILYHFSPSLLLDHAHDVFVSKDMIFLSRRQAGSHQTQLNGLYHEKI